MEVSQRYAVSIQKITELTPTILTLALFFPIFYRNSGLQILDDPIAIQNPWYPPFSEAAKSFRNGHGREFSGFGALFEFLSYIPGNTAIKFTITSFIIFCLITILILQIVFPAESKKTKLLAIIGIAFAITTSPEIHLTFFKIEKFSVLGLLLIVLSFRSDKHSKILLISGLTIGVFLAKETFIFALLVSLILSLFQKIFGPSNDVIKNYTREKLLFLGLLSFLAYRIVMPKISVSGFAYSSQLDCSVERSTQSLTTYLFRNPTIFVVCLLSLISFLILRHSLWPNEKIVWMILWLTGFLEICFFTSCWPMLQIYYLYTPEVCMTTSLILILFSKGKRKRSIRHFQQIRLILMAISLLIFCMNAYITFVRSEIQIAATRSNNNLIREIENTPQRNRLVLDFPAETEMYGNISFLSQRKITSFSKSQGLLCNDVILVPIAPPSNIIFGIRGISWFWESPDLSGLDSDKLIVSLVKSEIYKANYRFWGLGIPNLQTLFVFRPINFEYGWERHEVRC